MVSQSLVLVELAVKGPGLPAGAWKGAVNLVP